MRERLYSLAAGAIGALAPVLAMAQEQVDARLEGYKQEVKVPPTSSTTTWLLLTFLGIICLIGLFKNAKRTHLD